MCGIIYCGQYCIILIPYLRILSVRGVYSALNNLICAKSKIAWSALKQIPFILCALYSVVNTDVHKHVFDSKANTEYSDCITTINMNLMIKYHLCFNKEGQNALCEPTGKYDYSLHTN